MQSLGGKFASIVKTDLAHAFSVSFWVAFVLVAITFAFSFLLPRNRSGTAADGGEAVPAVPVH